MLRIIVERNRICIGERVSVSFQRTLRIPDDGNVYPLPPSLGQFPVHSVKDYCLPESFREHEGVFIPMYQREAMWIGFSGAEWKPNAIKVGIGKINAISGEAWNKTLHDRPQDYIVCPNQPWLDGINAGDGFIRQFIAMPLGQGYSVEAQLSGTEQFGGIQLLAFEPKPGKFPDEPPKKSGIELQSMSFKMADDAQMGIGAGGKITQKIYTDPYGIDTWDKDNYGSVFVHIVNSQQFRKLTGKEPPPTPISSSTYTESGLPWFELYDEEESDIPSVQRLSNIKTVKEIDTEKETEDRKNETSIKIKESQLKKIHRSGTRK